MTAKYKEYFIMMMEHNKELFDEFRDVHDRYGLDEEKHQHIYNTIGEKVMEIAKDYEGRLCRGSENGGYNSFTPRLAEKFQSEIRRHFPLFDHIGIQVEPAFALKKISF